MLRLLCLALPAVLTLKADDRIARALALLAEEAAAFQRRAPDLKAEERLTHRSLTPVKKRFRPGFKPSQPRAPEWRTREIISEYTFTSLDAEDSIRELRRPVKVDGVMAPLTDPVDELAMAVRSRNNREKLRLLEKFEKLGLSGTVTDFGQVILLFSRRRQNDFEFRFTGTRLSGADPVLSVTFRQLEGPSGITVLERGRVVQHQVNGVIDFRASDLKPVRINVYAVSGSGTNAVRQEAEIEYAASRWGTLVPASVIHREYRHRGLVTENRFSYGPFSSWAGSLR